MIRTLRLAAAASRFADSVLALMTLEEKLGQLSMAPGYGTQTGPRATPGSLAQIRAGKLGSYLLISKYLDVAWTPLFPFGFGLSYTTFAYDSLVVPANVRAGEEVVQVYVRDDIASVAQPVRALKAFRRVSLGAGEKRTLSFVLGADALALYDRAMRRVVEPGTFTVFVGTNSAATLSASFEVAAPAVILAPAPPRFR